MPRLEAISSHIKNFLLLTAHLLTTTTFLERATHSNNDSTIKLLDPDVLSSKMASVKTVSKTAESATSFFRKFPLLNSHQRHF